MDPSLNFLNFWSSVVIDLIFQHLSGDEILSATLVDRSWNDFLSNHSLTAWKDIWIQPKVSLDLSCLENSTRRYQSLRAVNVSVIVDKVVEIIEKPGRKWKQLVIVRTTFKKRSQMEAIMQASSRTVESLELHTLSCEEAPSEEDLKRSFMFPHLKHLKISQHFLNECPRWLSSLFSRAPVLESVHLTNASDCIMKNLLLTSAHFKKLSLSGKFQDVNFFKELSQKLDSTIEEFEFNDILSSSSSDQNLSYFNNFFQSQSRTLKTFETDALLEFDEFETAFKMPNLHTLNIKSFHYSHDQIGHLLENLRASNVTPANLRNFNVQLMDQNLLELLAIYATRLERLRADELVVNNVSNPTWFPKLEKVKVFFINPDLEETIRAKSDVDRTKLEKLILDALPDAIL